MRRFDLRDIATHIHVILTCLPKADRSAGGWRGEQAVKSATSQIMEILAGAVVLQPDEVVVSRGSENHPVAYGPGQFGVTEPWPFEPGWRPPVMPKPPTRGNAS